MKIGHLIYHLKGKRAIQSKETYGERKGALLKIEFSNGMVGFADCHPWKELGDFPLETQLDLLKKRRSTRLTARSLFFAKIDAKARSEKYNLLDTCKIPTSHYLISQLDENCFEEVKKAWNRGFVFFKIKLGKDLSREEGLIQEIAKYWPQAKFRLDFNAKLNPEIFKAFLSRQSKWLPSIDFIEDPFPFDYTEWRSIQERFGISLAADEFYSEALGYPEAAKILIVKPATQTVKKAHQSQKIIVTSYLDHPLGQMSAAYVASLACQDPCGLLSHLVYESNLYSQMIHHQGPFIQPVQGYGFGFDELLMKETFLAI